MACKIDDFAGISEATFDKTTGELKLFCSLIFQTLQVVDHQTTHLNLIPSCYHNVLRHFISTKAHVLIIGHRYRTSNCMYSVTNNEKTADIQGKMW